MLLLAALLLIGAFSAIVCNALETDEQRLVATIFQNYNIKMRPVANTANVTNVTLNPALFSIAQTDEAAESITIVIWLEMALSHSSYAQGNDCPATCVPPQSYQAREIWNDIFLQWNSTEYGELEKLLIPISDIWYPDISVENKFNINVPIPDEKNYAIIDSDGTITISILQVLRMHCKYHIVMLPFDIQNCSMNLGSRMHTADKMGIFYKETTDMTVFHKNSEWDLISMTARKSTDYFGGDYGALWDTIHYDIVIQRKPSYYILTFVLPCFMITTVSIIGVFAPFNDVGDREEKVTMGLTTLLTMTIILTLIADKMPKSSEGLPLLGTYIMLQIGIAAVTSLIAVIIMYQNRKWTFGEPVPVWILTLIRLNQTNDASLQKAKRSIVSSYSGRTEKIDGESALTNGCKQQQTVILKNVQSMIGQIGEYFCKRSEEECLRKEWQRATQRLDLLLMIVFLAFNCIVTVCILIIGYSNLQFSSNT